MSEENHANNYTIETIGNRTTISANEKVPQEVAQKTLDHLSLNMGEQFTPAKSEVDTAVTSVSFDHFPGAEENIRAKLNQSLVVVNSPSFNDGTQKDVNESKLDAPTSVVGSFTAEELTPTHKEFAKIKRSHVVLAIER